ncbi:MAG: hypothetical protein FJ395_12280 [Verrucomicrobia bacterium]|nr:hypothetical protein [Verrucomicrobiota bacterium]
MKWIALIASLWLLCGSVNAAEQPKYTQQHLDKLFQEAVMLSQAGLYDEAEARCRKILSQMPNQPSVKRLLEDLQEKRRRTGRPDASAELRSLLNSIVLTEVVFREAPVTDVIAFLREESKKHTKDKTEINFVLMLPEGKTPTLTLTLRKIPMMEVLRYITVMTGLQCQVDPHAVVLSPPLKLAPAKPNAKSP